MRGGKSEAGKLFINDRRISGQRTNAGPSYLYIIFSCEGVFGKKEIKKACIDNKKKRK
jgi:hypothetical protein